MQIFQLDKKIIKYHSISQPFHIYFIFGEASLSQYKCIYFFYQTPKFDHNISQPSISINFKLQYQLDKIIRYIILTLLQHFLDFLRGSVRKPQRLLQFSDFSKVFSLDFIRLYLFENTPAKMNYWILSRHYKIQWPHHITVEQPKFKLRINNQ